MSEISENEIKSMTKEQNYTRGYFDGKQDILDKIRAEVEALNQDYYCQGDFDKCKDYVLDIIDEYRKGD